MLAQRGNAINIIALEPSEKNYQELQRNITSNPEFGKRITPVKNTVQNFKTDKKFTGLVCNPPFYQEKLSAQNSNRDLARNIRHLPPEELFSAAHRLLSPTGWISVIIPHEIVQRYKHTAEENGFKLLQETQVKGRANKPVKRHLLQWAKEASSEHTKTDTLVLEMNPREKSHEFKQLLFPYLLD